MSMHFARWQASWHRPAQVAVLALGLALAGSACGSEDEDGTTLTTTPTADPSGTTSPDAEDARGSAPADSVTFHPVLEEPGATTATGPPTPAPDQLGPAALDGTGVVGAEAVADQVGGWAIRLELSDDPQGIGAFNAVAAECFRTGDACPTGRLAIVVDGVVVSAPQIQTPEFAADQIQISGGGSRREAEALAAAIDAAAHGS